MTGKIASKEEVQFRLVMLKASVRYFKDHHITEKSKQGQLLSDFEKYLENAVTDNLIDPDSK